MDWAKTRWAALCWEDSGIERDGDAMSKALLEFIPADPNKAADKKWLDERGWTQVGTSKSWRSKCGEWLMTGPSGAFDHVLYFNGRVIAADPSRMTVALFEAAAREAVAK